MRRLLATLLVGGAACSSTPSAEELRARTPEPPARAKTARGTQAIDIEWVPNGLCWDAGERALYAVDQSGNRIMRWTDRRGFQVAASLPRPKRPAGSLGGVARTKDGRTVVTRSGTGKEGGTVIVISEVRGAEMLSSLPADRRRVAVAVSPADTVYVTSWAPGKARTGGNVSRVDLAGPAETDLAIDHLDRPVGVAVVENVLFVSDQLRDEIVAMSLSPPGSPHTVAQVESPDMLAPGPSGSLLIASKSGAVWQLAADGRLIRLLTSRQEVRGIAYDPAGKRMFFAEHDPEGVEHRLQIVPLR